MLLGSAAGLLVAQALNCSVARGGLLAKGHAGASGARSSARACGSLGSVPTLELQRSVVTDGHQPLLYYTDLRPVNLKFLHQAPVFFSKWRKIWI